MSRFRLTFLTVVSLLALPVAAQQRSPHRRPRPSLGGQPFELVACSLGCVRSPSGFSCRTVEVHVNEEVRLTFNRPLDLTSVSPNSFRLRDQTGATPPGHFAIDAQDPATLVYRPAMTFDSAGQPVFGLNDGSTYLLHVPGQDQDPVGPYLTSVDGHPNRTRLQCVLVASAGVADAVPGRPHAKLHVQVVLERDPVTGEPLRIGRVPAEGAIDVLRSSPIELDFADLMNPATLANPVTGHSSFLRVFFDPDGNIMDARDWVSVPGSFTLSLDQTRLVTHVRFVALGGLPASGTGRRPGRVVFSLSSQVMDLGGNTVLNAGVTSFVTEAR
jgi:hypothetical protein